MSAVTHTRRLWPIPRRGDSADFGLTYLMYLQSVAGHKKAGTRTIPSFLRPLLRFPRKGP